VNRTTDVAEISWIVLLGLAVAFWIAASQTHLKCCSQAWVEDAPSVAAREERAATRARQIKEVHELKKRTQEYAAAFLTGAVGLAIFCYVKARKRRLEQT
jgi:hypothetical protein